MKFAITIATLLALSVHGKSFAAACNETAPMYNDGDSYFDIDTVSPIPDQQHKALKRFFETIQGTWRGSEVIKTCEGHHSDPIPTDIDYTVFALVDQATNGALVLNKEVTTTDRKILRLADFGLTPTINRTPAAQRWHTLEFVDADTLIYSNKYRARNANGFTRLIHELRKVSYREGRMQIDRKLFVNGLIVEHAGTTLSRSTT